MASVVVQPNEPASTASDAIGSGPSCSVSPPSGAEHGEAGRDIRRALQSYRHVEGGAASSERRRVAGVTLYQFGMFGFAPISSAASIRYVGALYITK